MPPVNVTTATPTGWWAKLTRRIRPDRVVNICFLVVLFFSTLLTWRETIVLEDAYISSQRNNLKNVTNDMDAQLQFNTDRLMFFRNGMQSALQIPRRSKYCAPPSKSLSASARRPTGVSPSITTARCR